MMDTDSKVWDETDRLLRPRVASRAVSIPFVPGDSAALLPNTFTLAAPVTPTAPRRRLRKWMLLSGAAYVLLLLFWSASHLGVLNDVDATASHITFRSAVNTIIHEAKALQFIRMGHLLNTTENQPEAKLSMPIPSVHEKTTTPNSNQASKLDPRNANAQAEEHARSVKMLPAEEKKQRRLKCVGWRGISHCTPHGPRDPTSDKGCYDVVINSASGYCEVEDQDTGELFRVMKRYCSSLRHDATFRCIEAPGFVKYQLESAQVAEKALTPGFTLPNTIEATDKSQDGIVMVVYPKLIASAYATIRTLRTDLGCRLPIEICIRRLQQFFERVLFLDADNVPVRDPTYLFDSPEFEDTGAIFWPDFWHPGHTIFNIHGQSLLWEKLGTAFVNSFEQESGQLLIDRRRHTAPLELVKFYTVKSPNPFTRLKLAYGDKDLFRFAWMKLNMPFTMIQSPPAVAGKVINGSFCGMTMVQHDMKGEVLFLHRNSNKLSGEVKRKKVYHRAQAINNAREKLLRQGINHTPDQKAVDDEIARLSLTPPPTLEPLESDGLPYPVMWTHLLSFNSTSQRGFYRIQPYRATPHFPDWQRCYGQRELGTNQHFYTQEFEDLPFSGLESAIRKFAQEAEQIRQRRVGAFR
ncbi:putative Mannosyltransferase [Phytophthora infestans]|uniref:Putative Mannosyltransferase n=1 Tax=Phytophthora infestans TaxID=4787 RepID=A0A833RYJ5_PHYIN|nr:putative Mannosyltransferase [Phytophthora infestans]